MELDANEKEFVITPQLEQKLAKMLHPVTPNPEFVHRLKSSLGNTSSVVVEKSRDYLVFLVVGAGLVTGALFMWLLRKRK